MEPLAAEVLGEINLAREQPQTYLRAVGEELRSVSGGVLHRPTAGPLQLREGELAYQDAMLFLARQPPLPPLAPSEGLCRAAQEHCIDIGISGSCDHEGSDGSRPGDRAARRGRWSGSIAECIALGADSAREAVVQLIVDDGVPDRGHRRSLFSSALQFAGAACGEHASSGRCCVVLCASHFEEGQHNTAPQPRPAVASSAPATLRSPADAVRIAGELLREQTALGLGDLGTAGSEDEAVAKARLLLASSNDGRLRHAARASPRRRQPAPSASQQPRPAASPRPREACLGSCLLPASGTEGVQACFVGDRIELPPDPETVRLQMEAVAVGGWNDLIRAYCGCSGVITKVLPGSMLQVRFGDGEQWLLPAAAVRRPQPAAASPQAAPGSGAAEPLPAAAKALFIGCDYAGTANERRGAVQDCRTARAFLYDRGFTPRNGLCVLADEGGADPPTRQRVAAALSWLCEGNAPGDALFLVLGGRGGDGLLCSGGDSGALSGAELLRPLQRLPRGVSLLCVVDGHAGGAGGALLDLAFVLRCERDGGFSESRRPRALPVAASVHVVGCRDDEASAPAAAPAETGGLFSAFAAAMGRGRAPQPQQLLGDLRRGMQKRQGRCHALPVLASSRPLFDQQAVVELAPREVPRAVRPSPPQPPEDPLALAAALLPPPACAGRLIPLGDAAARCFVVLPQELVGSRPVTVSLYNGHPCFVLSCYNWLENDVVRPLGDTATENHESGDGHGDPAPVLRCRLLPGETKPFLEGVLTDGEDWRPGWRQEPLPESALRRMDRQRNAELLSDDQHARNLHAALGRDAPDPGAAKRPYSAAGLLRSYIAAAPPPQAGTQRPPLFYDLWFPPRGPSLGEAAPGGTLLWGRPRHWLPPGQSAALWGPRGAEPADVRPGWLGDGGLLGAMAALAELPHAAQPHDPLAAIFSDHTPAAASAGAYRLRLCAKGWWHDVTVDDWVPCVRRPKNSIAAFPAYCQPGAGGVVWAAVVEKALAKTWGSYAALESVSPGDALADLTGCPVEDLTLSSDTRPCWQDRDPYMFPLMHGWLSGGDVVVLCGAGGMEQAERPSDGPAPGAVHAALQVVYSEGAALLQIRDVWGPPNDGLWRGERQGESVLGQQRGCGAAGAAGTRWVEAAEAQRLFGGCWRCRMPPPQGGELRLWLPWQKGAPAYAVELSPDAPLSVTVQAHAQGDPAAASLRECALTLSLLERGAAPGEWALCRGRSSCVVDKRRVSASYEIGAGLSAALLVVHCLAAEDPPNGGVVLTLHYWHSAHPQLPLGGGVTLRGPAGTAQEQLRRNRATLRIPPLAEVEAVAQHRRRLSDGLPPVDPVVGSEFEL
eukprot:TRINITY_DN50007_c0_g1_i1.p1 TRINITY_DN50007_c0_g1~~TRINITY_DN50007_c0_g1_i1.p1  ORF type:complete len:1368 (+),score=406.53 TRINITY_DN50007_c0_g1_i1:84-4106(+)